MSEARDLELLKMLETANGLIRSFSAVCDREGANTHWTALKAQVRTVLAEQHAVLHPAITKPRAG